MKFFCIDFTFVGISATLKKFECLLLCYAWENFAYNLAMSIINFYTQRNFVPVTYLTKI